ncbi:MAG: hypothetical protein EP308_00545 [Burkholderiales bacterium]|nr:MAG: hypothetical protein EP308_00545 [Burkholderiales bacterium]
MVSPHAPPLRGSLPPTGADLARGGPSPRSLSPPRSAAARVAGERVVIPANAGIHVGLRTPTRLPARRSG